MDQHVGSEGSLGKREPALAAGAPHEARDPVRVDAVERRPRAWPLLEAPSLDGAAALEIIDETLVQEPEQLVHRAEASAHELPSGLPHEARHLPLAAPRAVARPTPRSVGEIPAESSEPYSSPKSPRYTAASSTCSR